MEFVANILGWVCLTGLSIGAAGLGVWLSVVSFKSIDWHMARMIFKNKERRECCLEPADALVRDAIIRGHDPFTLGSGAYRKRYEFLKQTARSDFPKGYITMDEEQNSKTTPKDGE